MANEYINQGLTGRYDRLIKDTKSTCLLVAKLGADFNPMDKGNVVNDTTKSGKQEAALAVKAGIVHIASGSSNEAPWYATTIASTIIPA